MGRSFSTSEAQMILRRQAEPVRVIDVMGRERIVSAKVAADTIFDGVHALGHQRRIKVIKPTDASIALARVARADMRDVMQNDPRLKQVQRNRQKPGAKTWVPQPSRARSGRDGSFKTIFLPKSGITTDKS